MRSPGELAQIACVAEVCAPKAGNVHPGADFEDMTWQDLVRSASVVTPILNRAAGLGVGATVLESVLATREAIGSNTNLGMLLLLAPLCAVPAKDELKAGLRSVLAGLDQSDTYAVYEAIATAQPGGLGKVERADVADGAPSMGLIDAMALSAQRDAVARQYANNFDDVLNTIAPRLVESYKRYSSLDQAIVWTHLKQMADQPDTLIGRKCGAQIADESAKRAQSVIDADWPDGPEAAGRFEELDRWLRDQGHQRNPGASADLICAGLYAVLREAHIEWPALWSSGFPEVHQIGDQSFS